jgi:hypothetical protein
MLMALAAALLSPAASGPLRAQQRQPAEAATQPAPEREYAKPAAPGKSAEHQAGFYDVEQLERLFHVAKESGFGEAELRQITIEDEHGKTVNAWEYLEEMKRRRTVKTTGDQERLRKIYLTVQDVLAELRRREKEDLRDLRDKSVFKE